LERDDLEHHFSKLERIQDMLDVSKIYSSTKYEDACGPEFVNCWQAFRDLVNEELNYKQHFITNKDINKIKGNSYAGD